MIPPLLLCGYSSSPAANSPSLDEEYARNSHRFHTKPQGSMMNQFAPWFDQLTEEEKQHEGHKDR